MICPICRNTDLALLTTRLRRGPGKVFHCRNCDLGILENTENTDLAKYYADEYWKTHGPDLSKTVDYPEVFASYVDYQGRRLDLLAPYLSKNSRLLEVGCATGHFLYNVKPLVGDVVGVDYDAAAAAFAAERCGCRTFGGALQDAGLSPHSFDLVCAFQTVEHVPDPVGFITELARYLKPGGVLVLEVPNLSDPLLAVYDVPAYRSFYYHGEHQLYFSARSLTRAAGLAGFEGQVHFVQDYNFTNHLHWVYRDGPQPTCHDGLGRPQLPLAEGLAAAPRAAIGQWLVEVDASYKRLLATLGLTENITLIGSAKGA